MKNKFLVVFSILLILSLFLSSCATQEATPVAEEPAETEAAPVVEETEEMEEPVEEEELAEPEMESSEAMDALVESLGVDPGVFYAFTDRVAAKGEEWDEPDMEPIKIGYTSPGFDLSDALGRYYDSFVARLDEIGIPYEIVLNTVASHTAHAEQLAQVEAFIESDMDFVVLSATELQAQVESMKALRDADVPFILMNFPRPLTDEEVDGAQPLAYVGHDHEVGAIMTGEWTCERTGGEPIKAALIGGAPGSASDQRTGGWKDVVENCDVDIVFETNTTWQREEGYDAAIAILQGYPEVTFINAVASGIGLGAQAAANELGRDDVDITGFGGTLDELESMLRGEMAGSITRMTDDNGVAMAEILYLHFSDRGDEIPLFYSGQFVMVDDTTDVEILRQIIEYQNRYSGNIPWDKFEPLFEANE